MKPALLTDARGAVATEFLIAFVPVFILLLGTLQLVLFAAASLVVQHAAIVGVRSASVVLPDDPRHYDDEAEGSIAEGGPRLATIRGAVSFPLWAIAGTDPLPNALTLSFPARPGSDELRSGIVDSKNITLRVTYLLRCRVPLAATLLCDEQDQVRVRTLQAEATLPLHRMRSAP